MATGKNLYLRECQQCHGNAGKGDGAMAAFLGKKVANLTSAEVLDQPNGALYTKIRTGRPPMPGFKNSLTKDKLWHLVNFIRSEFGPKTNLSDAGQKTVSSADSQSGEQAHQELFKKSEFPSAQECGTCHPGIFPINSEAQEFATPDEWLSFNVEAGLGTEQFENSIPQETKFPGIWADPEERKAAREIIDQQLALLAENRDRATTLLRNGYGLGEVKILEKENGLDFDVEVKNLTEGHSVPSGLIAERNVFLQVTVTDADGAVIFRTGGLDPNGDVRDTHSLYVHNDVMPRDEQLFNLRSPILVGTLHGGEREQVLPANYSLNPLTYMRPSDTPSLLFGGIRDLRLQKKSGDIIGFRRPPLN